MPDPGSIVNSVPRTPADIMRRFADIRRRLDQLIAAVGALSAPGDWQSPALLNSWAVALEAVQYRQETDGDVRLAGRITGGATGSIAMTLPSAYWPVERQDFPLVTDVAGMGSATVGTSGNVTISIPGGATWVSLAPIRYPTT